MFLYSQILYERNYRIKWEISHAFRRQGYQDTVYHVSLKEAYKYRRY